MIKLYTEEEFETSKCNDMLRIECVICHQPFLKLKRSIQSVIRGDDGCKGLFCSKKCESESKKTGDNLKCEICGKEFYRIKSELNIYNNFCSHSCSATYNNTGRVLSDYTKEKIRKKLETNYDKKCPHCQKSFTTHKKDKIFCDKNCWKNYNLSKEKIKYVRHKRNWTKPKKDKPLIENRGGYREKGGRCKQIEYINIHKEKMMLNREEIIVAEHLDKLKLKWNRNKKGFNYLDLDNKYRKFYPDFYIEDYDFYVEYKGWVIEKMTHKMINAIDNNDIKLLIIYTNNKKFKHLGYNLENLIDDPNSLLDKMIWNGQIC